jgi:uncharacterized RDD family membrane protein YckC
VTPPAAPAERSREIVTPEGVPLRFAIAPAGDRVGALLLDLLAIGGAILSLGIPLGWLAARGVIDPDLVFAALLLATFLVWTGIRVIDAAGGPLRAEAILARSLTREAEMLLPVLALSAGDMVFPGAPGLARLAALAWLALFGLLPLFNRDRLRVGDLLAGTVVVRQPRAVLLAELTAHATAGEIAFTSAQLDVYGIYELQVLEGVLRQDAPDRAATLAAVASKIQEKLDWEGDAGPEPFLRAFYAALRGRLEARLLLGKRRASKHDRAG